MSGRLRILVDQDGVLADWHGGIEAGLTANGSGAEALDPSRWDLGMDPETRRLVRSIQAQPGFYRDLEPIEGAVEALHELLAQGHDVRICTTPDATNPTCASDKIAWVREHLGEEWVKRIDLTHNKAGVRGDVLIDDKPIIEDQRYAEWRRIIFDQPYNRDVEGARLTRWTLTDVGFAVVEALTRVQRPEIPAEQIGAAI